MRDRAYESSIIMLLRRIYGTRTGHALFREIDLLCRGTLTIRPAEQEGKDQIMRFDVNASSSVVDWRELAVLPGKGRTTEVPGPRGNLFKEYDMVRFSTGHTDDVDIRFTPEKFSDFVATHRGLSAFGTAAAQPDEILLHEVVHAIRLMRGIFGQFPVGFGYDDEEEFFAILVANIYASEMNRVIKVFNVSVPDLRCNHHGYEQCSLTDEGFLPEQGTQYQADENYRLVKKFIDQHAVTAQAMKDIDCSFNPIRRYFELTARGRLVS